MPLQNRPAPETIYHYTDDMGLRGILESGRLWLTDIFNLNDPSELKHGLEISIKLLEENTTVNPPEVGEFFKQVVRILRGQVDPIAHYFVCCFSDAGDDLGQWRAYADNGRGYALGFDGNTLRQAFDSGKGGVDPGRSEFTVTYEDVSLVEIQKEIIHKTIPFVSVPRGRNLTDENINCYIRELLVRLLMLLFSSAIFFKHHAYSNEREYRFLSMHRAGPVPDQKFRSRPHSLIRYREFDWKTVVGESLKEIVIGPAADPNLAFPFVRNCLHAYHPGTDIRVRQSDIPYRATR